MALKKSGFLSKSVVGEAEMTLYGLGKASKIVKTITLAGGKATIEVTLHKCFATKEMTQVEKVTERMGEMKPAYDPKACHKEETA